MEIYIRDISIDELEKGNVTVEVDHLYYDYSSYFFNDAQNFVFRVDLESGTVTIVTLPDLSKAY